VPPNVKRLLRRYDARYVGDAHAKVVYLTFDAAYENGLTARILDTLAAADVPATFFVTGAFIRDNRALVRRMAAEGHVVANHTFTHPSLPSLAWDEAALEEELASTARAFAKATGGEMPRILRPPSGEYSARTLCLARRLGYATVFWSFAHRDWVVDDQPPAAVTLERILGGSHNGAVYLLHAVSSSDAEALPDAIDGLRRQGYRFGVLTDLLEGP
jgi:peptidoglycan-N-acetylmuramic acid deacetylase